jgi:branched chain amino acid efflux pump
VMLASVAVLLVMNAAFKAAGPALIGGRQFPVPLRRIIDLLPPALIAGLVMVDLLGQDWVDADWTVAPGLAIAVVMRLVGLPHLGCIAAAVAVTAGLRALR